MKLFSFFLSFFFLINSNAQTITNYTTADGLLDNFVECINVDVDDNIWFGTSVGFQKYDPSTPDWTNFDIANYPNIVSNSIKQINSTLNSIWVGSDYGINMWNEPVITTYNSTNGLASNQVQSIDVKDNSPEDIWIGTNQGVSYFDGNSWVSYSSPDLHWSGVNATAFDSNGDKWFASPLGGVTHFDGTTFTVYDTSNGLLSQNVTALLIDNQDNKWIGTGSGMSVLNASNTSFTQHTRMYIMPPPDTLNPVVDIAMDSYGRIWAAIYVGYLAEGGIAYWDGNQWEDFHVSDGLVGPNVRGLAIDSEDNVWVATSTGVSKISSIPSSLNSVSISNVEVFPNPSSGIITVSCDENLKNIEIYNVLGSLIQSEKIHFQNEISINLSHLSSGIYHLVLRNENLVLNQKIIIE
tara:strand:- start:373 stop:1599 length:1227 start_codon:yes stop_codon:yes gene_type:complete